VRPRCDVAGSFRPCGYGRAEAQELLRRFVRRRMRVRYALPVDRRGETLTQQGTCCYILRTSCFGLVVKREGTVVPPDSPTPLTLFRDHRPRTASKRARRAEDAA
jgi:hypothetical protein